MTKFVLLNFFFLKNKQVLLKYDENYNDVKAIYWKPSQISQILKKYHTTKHSPGIQALKYIFFLNTFGQMGWETSLKMLINLRTNNFSSKMTINISIWEIII